jgi:general secretion pathway protein D
LFGLLVFSGFTAKRKLILRNLLTKEGSMNTISSGQGSGRWMSIICWCAWIWACGLLNDSAAKPQSQPTAQVPFHLDPAQGSFRRYALRHQSAENIERRMRQVLAGREVQIFVNPARSDELVVFGDAELLGQCNHLISELDRNTGSLEPRNAVSTTSEASTDPRNFENSASASATTPAVSLIAHQLSLQRINLNQVQSALTSLFPAQLKTRSQGEIVTHELNIGNQQVLKIGWDWRDPVVNLQGSPEAVEQFSQLLVKLDQESTQTDPPHVLAYRNASAFSVHQILDAYRGAPPLAENFHPSSNSVFGASAPVSGKLPVSATGLQAPPPRTSGWQDPLPGLQTTPPTAGQQDPFPGLSPNNPNQEPDTDQRRQSELLRQLSQSVQVETLPDLGVIILRGRPNEVQELSRIIQELERLSADSQPEVQIISLEHSRSNSVQQIVQTTSADLISGRVGSVSVTALGKPNALLVIGWGEAVTAVVDLIRKLDRPVDPTTQFEVFRLRHAEAQPLQTSLLNFLQGRDGLGTRVQVIADERSNSLVVYAAPRDLGEVRRFVEQLDVPGYQRRQQARVVRVQYAIASELAVTLQAAIQAATGTGPRQQAAWMELMAADGQGNSLLQAGLLEDVQITPNSVNNSLILSGPPESMDLLEALVKQLDVAGSTAQLKIFRIEHGDAATLVQMLRSLMPEQSIDRPALKMSSDPAETSLAPLRFSVDTRTNSIIATGSEGDLRIIQALLIRLDEKEFSERRNMVYRLKNAPATDVANAINNFLRSERQVQQAGFGNTSPFEQLEREVIVVPEPIGNRLILSSTPRFFAEIETLINQLDEPPPQVMIQVMIAEITLDNAREFGLEIGLQDSVLFDRSLLGNLLTTTQTTTSSTAAGVVTTTEQLVRAASNSPGYDFNNQPLGNSGSSSSLARSNVVGTQGLSNFNLGRLNSELGFGGLVLSASSESVSVLLRALQECRRLEILSRPQIRTLDNQPAFIQVGQRVPRIIGSTVNQAGQSNSIALENVGLILGVTPRISPDGTVVMEVDAERSGLGPESEGIPVSVSPNGEIIRSPRVDTTTAQATVSAANGETIILGGLITKRKLDLERKVPWLGDIPVLGHLFRYENHTTKRTELIIVLTPYIIRDRADELRMQQMEFARMNWCLCDVEALHGSLDGAMNPAMLDYDSSETQEFYPGQSPVISSETGQALPAPQSSDRFSVELPLESGTELKPPATDLRKNGMSVPRALQPLKAN